MNTKRGRGVPRLPSVSGRECIRALEKVGFYSKRQEGSHVILRRDDPFAQVSVPLHKELDRGTLRAIVRLAGLSVDEFVNLL
jgi:predicted RNA binding protein YcfA (HicA-like mRNA interferase family)